MKILLVDDDAFLRDMYATKFGEEGYVVLVAQTGTQALSILKQENDVDIVMLDMVMPGTSGVEMLKAIKDLNLDKFPNCIVLSNQSEDSDVQDAIKAGAVGYIVKAEMIPSDVVKEVKKLID
jgi:two-component system alkaline phosphatase synthesis response regulator PhoP